MAYQTWTLTQMQALLTERVEGVPFWTAPEATDAINEGLLLWNALTGYWRGPLTILTTANSFEYALDPAVLVFGARVQYNGKPLAVASMHEMDTGHPGWQGQVLTAGGNVPNTVRYWIPISIDMIAIWPQDPVGGNTLLVDGVALTPRLVNAGDFIDLGAEAFNALLGYALHVLAFKEGGPRFAATMPYYQTFIREAMEENTQLTDSDLFRNFILQDMEKQEVPTRTPATGITGTQAETFQQQKVIKQFP